ncbi:hypothetical protein PAA26_02805 [Methanomassiliicoccaceae archaeon COG_1]|nr:hypothetical protein [Methanomassiliicoccaceae archaeon COG_1]MDC7951003.1 hypothetical protein [Methanomassiliicoccaceae archaeon COG_1]
MVPEDIPSGEQAPGKVDLTPMLRAYQTLLDRLYWTSVSANNAAGAVWNIYDRADAKDYGVSTLMSSNVYDSVVLSEGMNEILTLSAMQQLATYYDANGDDLKDLQIGLYGEGMDAPFVRGSILDEFGNTVYSDVIFTPFFQSDSVVLERCIDYTVDQNCLVAVWTDGRELSSWYADAMRSEGYETAFIEKGYTFQITQLGKCDSTGEHPEDRLHRRRSHTLGPRTREEVSHTCHRGNRTRRVRGVLLRYRLELDSEDGEVLMRGIENENAPGTTGRRK